MSEPLVSTIMIFLNGERFIEEAVDSVFAQTYGNWELLLVDDGSSDGSTAYALGLAEKHPGRVRYVEHPGHVNRGMSASRNLGLAHARGTYVALLDADDVWVPHKLRQQVDLLERHPDVGMVYGNALYWHSWGDEGSGVDTLMLPRGVRPGRVYRPPELLPGYLTGGVMVPGTSCMMLRRDAMERVGGFEAEFRSMYEDQAFLAKIALHAPILIWNEHWFNYRQHGGSSTSLEGSGHYPDPARIRFLEWLERYLERTGWATRRLLRIVRRELWYQHHPRIARGSEAVHRFLRRLRRKLIPWTPPHSVRLPKRP